ncbi:ScbA/BarX family gamma-butyrolactone biosynthesis protein [Kitasatospora albolonga]|uniref:ScbA/BarX family gamma-butyrolactone biosynthesis protein n=1 Tax=Kitasatospora albolonga TaxID=68173 RepID=UPI0031EEC3F6
MPKELVHRAAVAEVLLTRWRRIDDRFFSVSAQWPRGHSFFGSPDGLHHDSTLIAETIRQVGTLLAHAEFAVPLTSRFLLHDLEFTAVLHQLTVRDTPAELEVLVSTTVTRQHGRRVAGLRYQMTLLRDGQIAAVANVSATFMSPEVYRRVRENRVVSPLVHVQPTPPVDPALVGRLSPADVVLSATGERDRWQLRLDTRHPVLFDHPGDHVPGMVMLEAARQAARIMVPEAALVSSASSEFSHYVEFDAPCFVEAVELPVEHPNRRTVSVRAEQGGRTVFASTLTVPTCLLRGSRTGAVSSSGRGRVTAELSHPWVCSPA